jgi:hypothetical protein
MLILVKSGVRCCIRIALCSSINEVPSYIRKTFWAYFVSNVLTYMKDGIWTACHVSVIVGVQFLDETHGVFKACSLSSLK